MTPEILDRYLKVLEDHAVHTGVLELGEVRVHVVFAPKMPLVDYGEMPTPGGWKSPMKLDDPMALDPQDTQDPSR